MTDFSRPFLVEQFFACLAGLAAVFAGLLTVIIIGLLVEGLIFRSIEVNTVRKWGMQR